MLALHSPRVSWLADFQVCYVVDSFDEAFKYESRGQEPAVDICCPSKFGSGGHS